MERRRNPPGQIVGGLSAVPRDSGRGQHDPRETACHGAASETRRTTATVSTFVPAFPPLNPRLLDLYELVNDRLEVVRSYLNSDRLRDGTVDGQEPYFGSDPVREGWRAEVDPLRRAGRVVSCAQPVPLQHPHSEGARTCFAGNRVGEQLASCLRERRRGVPGGDERTPPARTVGPRTRRKKGPMARCRLASRGAAENQGGQPGEPRLLQRPHSAGTDRRRNRLSGPDRGLDDSAGSRQRDRIGRGRFGRGRELFRGCRGLRRLAAHLLTAPDRTAAGLELGVDRPDPDRSGRHREHHRRARTDRSRMGPPRR